MENNDVHVECLDRETTLSLCGAVLLYGTSQGNKYFASIHGVNVDKDGRVALEAGVQATVEGLTSMFECLLPEKEKECDFVPETILSFGVNHLAWWCPPRTRRAWFDCKKLGKKTAEVPYPGLVFIAKQRCLYVFAVKGNGRPKPETELYQAPVFNVGTEGGVCLGNSIPPEGFSIKSVGEWETVFFDSRFTHPDGHIESRLVLWKGGVYSFWEKMLAGEMSEFPEEVLVTTKRTVSEIITSITR